MSEQTIQTNCIKHLKSLGAYVVKVISATKTGIPDVLVCIKGKFLAFEFKSETGRPTGLQEMNLRKIRSAGGQAYLIRSIDELKRVLEIEELC